ncbi:MAG: VWA domain-containing protein [Kiritimatiellia bacterium]
MSDSIGDAARRKALEFITNSAAGKPEADRVGMVVFGASAAVELPPRQSFPFEVINARVPTDGATIARALSLSGAVLADDTAARIVLISDGTQTSGQASEAVERSPRPRDSGGRGSGGIRLRPGGGWKSWNCRAT